MYTGKIRVASIYKEYLSPDTSTQSAEDLPKKISALDQVVGVIRSAESHLDAIQVGITNDKAMLLMLRSTNKAKAFRLAVVSISSYASQLDILLRQKLGSIDLKQDLATPSITCLVNESAFLAQLVDDAVLYPPTAEARRKKVLLHIRNRALNLVKHISILKGMFGEYRASLMLEQRAADNARQQGLKKPRTKALFDDGGDLQTVLEGFKNKGWRVDLRQNDTPLEDSEDGYLLSLALVNRVRKPVAELLPEDTTIGVLRFPAILRVRSRLSDRMIQRCTDPSIGYSVYFVFGGYVAVDNAIAIGINRNIMSVYNEHGQPTVDTDKFTALMPYTANEFPEWADKLRRVRPVQPAKLHGSHYYMLLMPEGTMGESKHSISDWSFLSY